MNTHNKYELPTLPEPFTYTRPGKSEGALFHAGHMQDYARAAIEADRKRRGENQEPFGYFRAEPFGWTDCAETDEGAIALYERPQVRGEPVGYIMPTALKQLKAGGNAIVGGLPQGGDVALYLAPQPAEPVKKKPYAQGTALGEFGVIPMCDQVDDEPTCPECGGDGAGGDHEDDCERKTGSRLHKPYTW